MLGELVQYPAAAIARAQDACRVAAADYVREHRVGYQSDMKTRVGKRAREFVRESHRRELKKLFRKEVGLSLLTILSLIGFLWPLIVKVIQWLESNAEVPPPGRGLE